MTARPYCPMPVGLRVKPREWRVGTRGHLCCAATTMAFFFMWPVLAVRDAYQLNQWLAPNVMAFLYVAAWSLAGFLALRGNGTRPVLVDRPGAVGALLFCSLWLVNFFSYPVPLDHEQVYQYYAVVYCICPLLVGLAFPPRYLGALGGWLGIFSVAFCAALILPLLQGMDQVFRNWRFDSINPITEATHLSVGVICLACSGVLRMPRVVRICLIGLLLWQLILTSSRGAIIGVGLTLILAAFSARRLRWPQRLAVLILLVIVVALCSSFSSYLPDEVRSRLFDIDNSLHASGNQGGALGRTDPIMTALRLGMLSPVAGAGLSQNAILGFYSHNLFSQAFLEVGLIGTGGLLLVIFRALLGFAGKETHRDRRIAFLGSLFIFYLIVHQFSFTAILALQLWFLAGVGTRLCGEKLRSAPRLKPTTRQLLREVYP